MTRIMKDTAKFTIDLVQGFKDFDLVDTPVHAITLRNFIFLIYRWFNWKWRQVFFVDVYKIVRFYWSYGSTYQDVPHPFALIFV